MPVATFPLIVPTFGFVSRPNFDPIRRQTAGVAQSGRDWVIDRGAPQWSISLKTKPLFNAEIGQWLAFNAALRGGARFFQMWDPWREYPAAYMPAGWGSLTRHAGGAFDGTATVTAIGASGLPSAARDTLAFGTLPDGFKLIAGDMVGLSQSGLMSLHRILDPTQLTSSAGAVTAWVEPEVPANFTTAAVAQFYRASGKFRMVSFSLPIDATGRNRPGQVTLSALSVLL